MAEKQRRESEKSASHSPASHLDGEMDDAPAVQSRKTARYLDGESPKLVIVLDAVVWFDAAAQIACDEFADAEANFGGGGAKPQVRHDEIDICDQFVHRRLVLTQFIVCRHFQNA